MADYFRAMDIEMLRQEKSIKYEIFVTYPNGQTVQLAPQFSPRPVDHENSAAGPAP
jgi:hypothetical protein